MEKVINLKEIFRSFKYRNYRLYFIGQGLSLTGTWMQRMALPWLVYRLTNSPFLLGFIGFITQIPTFILLPFCGVLSDKWNKYAILIITQILAMVQAFILTVLFYTNLIKIWHIIALGIFLGIVNAFELPSRQAFIVEIVNKNDLQNAIALNSSLVNLTKLIGPFSAGILISLKDEGICFLINGISFLFVIISLVLMRIETHDRKEMDMEIFSGLKDGFRYIFDFKILKYTVLLLGWVSLIGFPSFSILPVFVKDILKSGPKTFGFLMASSAIGSFIGAIYMAGKKNIENLEKIIPLSTLIFGISLIFFSLTKNIYLSIFIIFISGLGMVIQMVSSNTILQTLVDDDKRGRVMSFHSMAFMGIIPFGNLLIGSMAEKSGAIMSFIISGFLSIIGGLLYLKKIFNLGKEYRTSKKLI